MCLFTHFAAGALAGGVTGNVYAGAVAGLASHAVLDAIPHYDHPDWRLELGGGLLALVLLLLLPFGGVAAIVGGLCGMLPDLENLFQKLGWLSRRRFVFPSHTGLVPHGRELGARTLVWQVAIFTACFGLLAVLEPTPALAQTAETAVMDAPRVDVVSTTTDRTVVRITYPVAAAPASWAAVTPENVRWGLAPASVPGGPVLDLPRLALALAVPTRRLPTVVVTGVDWWREPGVPVAPAALAEATLPALQRGVPVAHVTAALGAGDGILAGLTVEIMHPADGPGRDLLRQSVGEPGRAARPLSAAGVLNPDLLARLVAGDRRLAARSPTAKAVDGDPFALTGNWVRLQLRETGLYRLTGSELEDMGVPATAVDPAKLRLFRGGGIHLHADPEWPDSLQSRRVGLNELAIQVLAGTDGEWNLDDEVRFYGVGTSAWLDRLVPGSPRLDHYDHPTCDAAVYWLTWEGDAVPSPLPGAPRRAPVSSTPAGGGGPIDSGSVRLHLETQRLNHRGLVADNFVWWDEISSTRTESFTVHRPVAGSTARFVVDVRTAVRNVTVTALATVAGDQAGAGTATFDGTGQRDSLRVRLVGTSDLLVPGENEMRLWNLTPNGAGKLALDAYDVVYQDSLVLESSHGALEFGLWGDAVTVPDTPVDLVVATSDPAAALLWDVSVPDSCLILAGEAGSAAVTWGLTRQPGEDRHFVAARSGDLRRVDSGERAYPVALRQAATDLDYVAVSHADFMGPAGDLAAYRSGDLPGVVSPRAIAVDVQDIYDNFAGGQKDLLAIRNYLRWLWEAGGHRLAYACLVGNASRDPREYRGAVLQDMVPTDLRTTYPWLEIELSLTEPYASDDMIGCFDTPPPTTFRPFAGVDLPDLAVGRLPAVTLAEARGMVDRAIAYAEDTADGAWRNRVLLLSDDAQRPSYGFPSDDQEILHTLQADALAEYYVPSSLDVVKIFGVAYEFPPGGTGVKPQAAAEVLRQLNAGTTIYYYVGHGSWDNLGDEQYFRAHDIANLVNGAQRPVFMAFSCDVGVYESTVQRSMAEQFVLATNGGAIAAICASQVSVIPYNNSLTNALYTALYPGREVDASVTLGEALRRAKSLMAPGAIRHNSQRYTLMGDPGIRLPNPVGGLGFATTSLDTLHPGLRQTVVFEGAGTGAGDGWDLRVEDSSRPSNYTVYTPVNVGTLQNPVWVPGDPTVRSWTQFGAPAFRTTGQLPAGELRVPFKSSTQSQTGEAARVRLIVDAAGGDRVAVQTIPAVRKALGPVDDVVGPEIELGFVEDRIRVVAGTPLLATLADTSSIAVLGTAPGNSVNLEFDDSGFLIDVTEHFAFASGDYTRGQLEVALPDLELGKHTAVLFAADALGNVGTAEADFELVPTGNIDFRDVTVFPNPTPGPCHLVFELVGTNDTDWSRVVWDIYTVSGRRVRSVYKEPDGRFLAWDGLDAEGQELANGTYLYVLRGRGIGRDGRDLAQTGKLVIMR